MPTASISNVSTTFTDTNHANFDITFSESVSGLSNSDFRRTPRIGGINHDGGNTYRFSRPYSTGAGYLRIVLPTDAVTPNLDTDFDYTFYWDAAGNISHGITSSVRASRPNTTLTSISWVNSGIRASAGSTRAIEFDFADSVSDFVALNMTLTGDITSIASVGYTSDSSLYRGNVVLPSDLSGGGSFQIVINGIDDFYPGLATQEDWTLSWDENGNLSASRTADLPVQVTFELIDNNGNPKNYVSNSEVFYLRMRFSRDAYPPSISNISLTDGMTIATALSPNNREWNYRITAPSTGRGQGVISIAENLVAGNSNAVTVTFDYVDSIEAEISLSANGIENGGTIIAQFDFDHAVPNFSASYLYFNLNAVVVDGDDNVLGINGNLLAIESERSDVTVGPATSIDENNRCWVVPVTVPETGEGELDISLPEDAIGFQQAAVQAPVFYAAQNAPTIRLNIRIQDNLTLLPIFGKDFTHVINITGNNISSVDVRGLLRPFYHSWNSTTGILEIKGRPEVFYENLEFKVIATDQDGTEEKTAFINVIDIAPRIIVPSNPLEIFQGSMNMLKIEVKNHPQEISVEGTWGGLDHSLEEGNIIISGDVPARGRGPNQAILGVNSGDFVVNASNSGGDADEQNVPWVFGDLTAPKRTGNIQSSFQQSAIANIDLNTIFSGSPAPSFEITGNLPTGTMFDEDTGIITGQFTTLGRFRFNVIATNSEGSITYNVNLLVTNLRAPRYLGSSSARRLENIRFSATRGATRHHRIVLSWTSGHWERGIPFGLFYLSHLEANINGTWTDVDTGSSRVIFIPYSFGFSQTGNTQLIGTQPSIYVGDFRFKISCQNTLGEATSPWINISVVS